MDRVVRERRKQPGGKRIDHPTRQEKSEGRCSRGQKSALGEQLPNEAAPVPADGQPDRHLLPALFGPGGEEAGNIRARDEKHQAGHGHEDGHEQPDQSLDLHQRDDAHVAPAVRSEPGQLDDRGS